MVLPLFSLMMGLASVALPAQPATVLSVNPILPLLGLFQGEVEHRLGEPLAVAVSASHLAYNTRITDLMVRARFYPQERAMAGLGLAVAVGLAHTRGAVYASAPCLPDGCPVADRSVRGSLTPAMGVDVHYQWLLGRRQRTAVAAGVGVTRYLLGGTFPELAPAAKLTVGWGFGRR